MTRVCLSTSVIQRGRGGVGQYVLALVKALAAHRSSIDLYLFILKGDLELFTFCQDYATIIEAPEENRNPIRDILWHQRRAPKICADHGVQVLHIPSYRRMIASRRIPTVATIHDVAPFTLADKYDWKRMIYGRYVARFLARRQRKVIAVSETTASEIQKYFRLPADRVEVVLNGLDHERFRPDTSAAPDDELRARLGLANPFFLYIARLEHPAKNHVRLIQAFERYRDENPDGNDLALGGSDWHGADVIHEAIRSSRHAARIHNLGFVADGDVPRLYRAAQALVFPSLFEGFGLPPLEAMACGTPVASSPNGALREVVGDAGLLFDPESVSAIADALSRIDQDEELRAQLRSKGLARAEDYKWSLTAKRMVEIYQRTANSN